MSAPALTGVRVLEIGGRAAAAIAGRYLADYGAAVTTATVTSAVAAGADPDDGAGVLGAAELAAARQQFLEMGKQTVAVDLGTPAGRHQLECLIADSDIVLDGTCLGTLDRCGLPVSRCMTVQPAVVLVSINPFGATGPDSGKTGTDLLQSAAGGWAYGIGDPAREPLKAPGLQTEVIGGLCAASAALASHLRSRESGQGDYIDLSIQESVTFFLMNPTTVESYSGEIWRRDGGITHANYPQGLMPCADGMISVNVMYFAEWQRLCDVLHTREWLVDPRLATPIDRLRNRAIIDAALMPWISRHTVAELYEFAQRHKLPFSPVKAVSDLLFSPQLAAREYWRLMPVADRRDIPVPGLPFKLRTVAEMVPGTATRSPGTRAGQLRPAGDLPLAGVRIVDLTMAWAGPLATRILGELGAEVIKIEGPAKLDRWRGGTSPQRGTERYPNHDAGADPWNRSSFFNTQNVNKYSLGLDLKTARGRALLEDLIASADMVVENFSAGAMGRLGLEFDDLRRLQPGIVMVSMPGFGKTGPDSGNVAHGPTIEAAAGNLALQGYEDGDPLASGFLAWGDPVAGLTGGYAALVAWASHLATGNAVQVDLSQVEAGIMFNFEAVIEHGLTDRQPERFGNRSREFIPQGIYPVAGYDRWIAVSCMDDQMWRRLAAVIAGPDGPAVDEASQRWANRAAIDKAIAAWSAPLDTANALAELAAAGVAAAPVNDARDLNHDPHLAERGFFRIIDHPSCGRHQYPGMPWRSLRCPWQTPRPAPRFGADNALILGEILALTEDEISALRQASVIADIPAPQGD
jgi:crotonobetainyl-CoA:carnitine CoA-transferase CaiB-like acyl-CoA transferase